MPQCADGPLWRGPPLAFRNCYNGRGTPTRHGGGRRREPGKGRVFRLPGATRSSPPPPRAPGSSPAPPACSAGSAAACRAARLPPSRLVLPSRPHRLPAVRRAGIGQPLQHALPVDPFVHRVAGVLPSLSGAGIAQPPLLQPWTAPASRAPPGAEPPAAESPDPARDGSRSASCGRNAHCCAPPAQIRTWSLNHPAPTSGD